MNTGNGHFFEVLYQLARAFHNPKLDAHTMMQMSLNKAGERLGVSQGCLLTFNTHDEIQNAYVINADNPQYQSNDLWETLLDQGLIGYVYHAQRTVVIRNIETDPRWPQSEMLNAIVEGGSVIGLPLYNTKTVYGVMMFIHHKIDYFDEPIVDFLVEVADLTAEAINRAVERDQATLGKKIPYKTLFDDAVVPGLLTDLNGKILDANHMASDFLAYTRRELQRETINSTHRIEADAIGERNLRDLALDEEMTFRAIAITAKGVEIPVIMRARRLCLDDRDVIEWVEQDISVQMELEQLRRDLSAMVYHDLRGPLQAIRGSIHKLADVLSHHDNPAVLTLLQIGVRSTRQLRHMIDGLLDIQRLEEGKAILNRTPTELREVLADAVQLVQPLALDMNQSIEFDVSDDLPIINIDNDMIMRVVINLIENATKYTPEGSDITVSAHRIEDMIQVKVSDSGPGIPKEAQPHIFGKFNRVRHQGAPKGIGLGLAFCRLAVDAHGGHIWVESEPGEGAHFIFTLPTVATAETYSSTATQLIAQVSA